MKMRKLIIIGFILLVIFITSSSVSACWHGSHYVRFGVFIAPPPVWIGPPVIVYRGYYPPVYYCPTPPPYCYPSPPPYYSSQTKIKIEVSSIPENCELEVNGVYQGLTPLSIELTQGVPVLIKLSKVGYIPWEKVVLPKPDMRLSPELEKKPN